MNKVFSYENLTPLEHKAIKSWTDTHGEYRIIKEILKGEYHGTFYQQYQVYANLLNNMFTEYEDNTKEGLALYRGDIFDKETVDETFEIE